MDKLDEIFLMQRSLDEEIAEKRGLPELTREVWIQRDVLAIISELGELLDEVNFKWWKNPKALDEGALKEELADVLHFFVSMCIRAGMSADELHRIYIGKNKENVNRQHGLSKKEGYRAEGVK